MLDVMIQNRFKEQLINKDTTGIESLQVTLTREEVGKEGWS